MLRIPRSDFEDLDTFCRRKNRLARNVCQKIGFWSEDWARRFLNWHEHVGRSRGVLKDLLQWKDSGWLQMQRSRFVSSNGSAYSRNSLTAGRTGTRARGRKPQPRWEAGVSLARAYLDSRGISQRGANAITVSSRIREAARAVRRFFVGPDPDPDPGG